MAETKQETVSVTLSNLVSINGVKYEVGTHEVPADVAEDLTRMDADYNTYELGLNKNKASSGSLGSVSAA